MQSDEEPRTKLVEHVSGTARCYLGPVLGTSRQLSAGAFGSSASCTTISDISISSRRPCNLWTTHSTRSASPMSQLRPRRPDRDALSCILGMAGCGLAPLSPSTPEARRGAQRGVDGDSASRAKMDMPWMRRAERSRTACDQRQTGSTLEQTTLKPPGNPFGTRLSPMS